MAVGFRQASLKYQGDTRDLGQPIEADAQQDQLVQMVDDILKYFGTGDQPFGSPCTGEEACFWDY